MKNYKIVATVLMITGVVVILGMNYSSQGVDLNPYPMMGMSTMRAAWMDSLKSFEVIGSLVFVELVMTSGKYSRIKFRNLRACGECEE